MVAALRKGNEGCFTCGDKNHFKRDCLKKVKNLQKSALAAIEECIGPKIVNPNLTLKGNLFRGNSKQGTLQVPFNKNQWQIPSFPSNPQQLAALQSIYQPEMPFSFTPRQSPLEYLPDFLDPCPQQTFGLLLGRSSLTPKGITVHPGVIDSDYKGEIQIMMSSQILWQFKKGDKIAQSLLLPYISINSSNNIQTSRFGRSKIILMDIIGISICPTRYKYPN